MLKLQVGLFELEAFDELLKIFATLSFLVHRFIRNQPRGLDLLRPRDGYLQTAVEMWRSRRIVPSRHRASFFPKP